MITALENHLWQSTLFCCVVALLTPMLRSNRAAVRHWLWLAASVKFLIPFSVLVSLASQVEWRRPAAAVRPQLSVVEGLSQPFGTPTPTPLLVSVPRAPNRLPVLLIGVWLCGFAAQGLGWWRRWRQVRAALRFCSPLHLGLPLPTMSTSSRLEPGVFGIFRPVLVLPEGITEYLTPSQFESVLAHELCHARRRDNLAAAVHLMVEALFWFHPLVWWIRVRLVEERERACDEEVLRAAIHPQDYAEGIVAVCRYCLKSPLVCVSGVTGSNLKRRVEAIMMNRNPHNLSFGRKLLLACGGLIAIAGALAVGVTDTPTIRAQSRMGPAPKYEVAVIRPGNQDQENGFDTEKGRFLAHNATIKKLIARAYDLDTGLISGGPKWVDSDRYDINAKFPAELSQPTGEQGRLMLQGLLADRFQLIIHREASQVSGYALVVAKNGPRMERADSDLKDIKIRSSKNGQIIALNVTMDAFARDLNHFIGSPVVDRTGLSGYFKFELNWAPESPEPSPDDRPTFFAALQQQLGLRLQSTKIPVSAIVIDRVDRPSEN